MKRTMNLAIASPSKYFYGEGAISRSITTALIAIYIVVTFTACNKESATEKTSMEYEIANEKANLLLSSVEYETSIVNSLIKLDDYAFYTEGAIEYRLNDERVALVDFGEGKKDNWATKTIDGETFEFDLKHKSEKSEYEKRIIKPLVKTEDCEYIVEGTIEYLKGNVVVATIDYGDGGCDEWATKTRDGETKVFSLNVSKTKNK